MPERKSEWTVVVLSETQARMRQFRVKKTWLIVAVAAAVACVTLLLVLSIMTWSLSSQIEDNTAMKARLVAVSLRKVDGMVARQNGAVNQPVSDFIMFNAWGRTVMQTGQP